MRDCWFQEALNAKWLSHKNASCDHSQNRIFREGKQIRKTDLHAWVILWTMHLTTFPMIGTPLPVQRETQSAGPQALLHLDPATSLSSSLGCAHLAPSSWASQAALQFLHPQRLGSLGSLSSLPHGWLPVVTQSPLQCPRLGLLDLPSPTAPSVLSTPFLLFRPGTYQWCRVIQLLAFVLSVSPSLGVSAKQQKLVFLTVYSQYPEYHLEGQRWWIIVYWLNQYVNAWTAPAASVTCPVCQTAPCGFRGMT